MSSFDYNYQNALRCSLCYADLCHARAILHKRTNTECNSLPQSILVLVVKDVIMKMAYYKYFRN